MQIHLVGGVVENLMVKKDFFLVHMLKKYNIRDFIENKDYNLLSTLFSTNLKFVRKKRQLRQGFGCLIVQALHFCVNRGKVMTPREI